MATSTVKIQFDEECSSELIKLRVALERLNANLLRAGVLDRLHQGEAGREVAAEEEAKRGVQYAD